MKLKILIFPIFVGLALTVAVVFWIDLFFAYEVQARVAGLDGRPQQASEETGPQVIEGTLVAFQDTAFAEPPLHPAPPESWPNFRGADYTAVVQTDVTLAKQFSPEGPKKLWQVELGQGYAAPAIYNERVYLIDYDTENQADAIRCFSLDTGVEIWQYSYPVKIKRNHGMSRTIPATDGKYLVTIGPRCHVTCLDITTGEFKWMIDLVGEYGTKEPLWYAGQCPIIKDGNVIIAPAGDDVLMMAVDCQTGEVVWKTPNPDKWEMTHCSILPVEFGGIEMYLYPASRGVAAVRADTGEILWTTDAWYLRTNVPTPVDCGDGKIFLSAGYNKGSMMLQMIQNGDIIEPKVLHELKPEVFGSDQQTPLFYQGHIYGVRPDKQLVCKDLSGNILWTSGSEQKYGLGPYMIINDILYVLDDEGWLSLIRPTPEKFELLSKNRVLEGHECWGPPAYASGKLLVRDLTTLVCLDIAVK